MRDRTAVEDAVAPGRGGRRLRVVLAVAWVIALAALVATSGVPTDRGVIAALIISALLVSRVGQGFHRLGLVVVDWLPFTLVLLAYDRTRGVADALGMPVHVKDALDVERHLTGWLTGGDIPTVWLQHHLYDPDRVHWWDVACTLVYTSHFLVTPVLAAVLWLRHRDQWLRYITRVVVLSAAGLVTYCLFPQAPPWLAARDGFTEPVARLSSRGWIPLHLGNVGTTLEGAQRDGANPVAAMPSLHTAFAVLVAITVVSALRGRPAAAGWRWLALLYPVAMGFALVYTGEHYVIDLVAGALYATAVHLLLTRYETGRAARRAAADAAAATDTGETAEAPLRSASPSA